MQIKQKGSIKWILIIIIAIALASYYLDFSVREIAENEQTKSNLSYIWENISDFYLKYLSKAVSYVWNDIFVDIIWKNFLQGLGAGKSA